MGTKAKVGEVHMAPAGFGALDMSAPAIVQMNPEGQWQTSKPENLDEKKLRAVVQHLVNSNTIAAAQSYCSKCAKESEKTGNNSQYVPVIMMPIYPADQCPFDLDCEIEKQKMEVKGTKKKDNLVKDIKSDGAANQEETKKKQKGFTMQRLTDFDLLSQW